MSLKKGEGRNNIMTTTSAIVEVFQLLQKERKDHSPSRKANYIYGGEEENKCGDCEMCSSTYKPLLLKKINDQNYIFPKYF